MQSTVGAESDECTPGVGRPPTGPRLECCGEEGRISDVYVYVQVLQMSSHPCLFHLQCLDLCVCDIIHQI